MFRTQKDVQQFENIIKKHVFIECDRQGNWKPESTCHRINQMLRCHHEKDRLVAVAKAFCHLLDNLEKTPILFEGGESSTKEQVNIYKTYFDLSDTVIEELENDNSKEVQSQLDVVKIRLMGLRYRIGAIHGGLDREILVDEELCKQVFELADGWKSRQKLYPTNDKKLKQRDLDKIIDVCQYPIFAKLLMSDRVLQDVFFKWTIRDNNGVEQFVEFPGVCARLRAAFLDKRVGRLAPSELSIQKPKAPEYGDQAWTKDLCLPFFDGTKTNRVSILDESREVMLNGNRRISIKEIFDIFVYKTVDPGNISYFGSQGISNWRIYECGEWNPKTKSYDRIDLNAKDWWKQLPIFEALTQEQVEKRYALSPKPGEWIKCIKASRESLDYSLFGRHGYVEMVIPLENGLYGVYPFGLFPLDFPTSTLKQAHLITQTVAGRVAYADENTTYSQRQHAVHSRITSAEGGALIMEQIRKDILRGIQNELPFQLKGENCSHWAQEVFNADESNHPCNFFRMQLINMKPSHFVIDKVLDLPTPVLNGILKGLRFLAKKDGMLVTENGKKVHKVSSFAKNINDDEQLQPGLVFGMIEDNRLKGSITFGN